MGALVEAADFLEEAVRLAPRDPNLLLDLGEVHSWLVRADAADATYARAMTLLEGADPAAVAEAWLMRARAFRSALCMPHESLLSCRKAIAALDRAGADAPEVRARAMAGLAWAESAGGG